MHLTPRHPCLHTNQDYPPRHAGPAFRKMFRASSSRRCGQLFFTAPHVWAAPGNFGPISDEYAQKAIPLDPNPRSPHFLLGEFDLYHFEGFPSSAMKISKKKLQLKPGYAPAYSSLPTLFAHPRKFDEAEKLQCSRSIWLDSHFHRPRTPSWGESSRKEGRNRACRSAQQLQTPRPGHGAKHPGAPSLTRPQGLSHLGRHEARLPEPAEPKVAAHLESARAPQAVSPIAARTSIRTIKETLAVGTTGKNIFSFVAWAEVLLGHASRTAKATPVARPCQLSLT